MFQVKDAVGSREGACGICHAVAGEICHAGGRTLIRRSGLGVVATFLDKEGKVIAKSPPSCCPTCAVAIGAARTPSLAKHIRDALKDATNTGQKKFKMGIENRYIVKGGGVKVTLARGEELLAKSVRGCTKDPEAIGDEELGRRMKYARYYFVFGVLEFILAGH
jgi:hypothetical protein